MFTKIAGMLLSLILTFSPFEQTTLPAQQTSKKEYTLQEKAKLKQAEELAERFVQRWHETLDWKLLFEEFYVKNAEYRKWTLGHTGDFEEFNEGDLEFFSEFAFYWHSSFYFERELHLIYEFDNKNKCVCPPEFTRQEEKYKAEGTWAFGMFDQDGLYERLSIAEKKYNAKLLELHWSAHVDLCKLALPEKVFSTASYQTKLLEEYPLRSEISSSGLPADFDEKIACYSIGRGIFDFYFIEEDQQLCVLWID